MKKIDSLTKKIQELTEERNREQAYLEGGEAGIRALTGGYASYELIKCEYVPQFNEDGSPKMDKDGKYQLKKQVLTFVPPTEAPVTKVGNNYDADSCGCNSCECNMGLSEEEWKKVQDSIAEAELKEELLRTGELKPEDIISTAHDGLKLESDPQSFTEQVNVTMPANDNTSTEAND